MLCIGYLDNPLRFTLELEIIHNYKYMTYTKVGAIHELPLLLNQDFKSFCVIPKIDERSQTRKICLLLSAGTSGRDRGEKFTNYLTMPTLQEYILISSDKILVERYARGEGRMWLYYPYIAGDTITLSSLGFEFAIEVLYDGIATVS